MQIGQKSLGYALIVTLNLFQGPLPTLLMTAMNLSMDAETSSA